MREIPALDGMRGIAALLVVGFHVLAYAVGLDERGFNPGVALEPAATAWLNWGFIGVDFFFVLSAFLLAQPFLARGVTDLRGYAGKRLLRVLPPYYASLVLGWLIVGHSGHDWFALDARQLWTHLTFTHGFWADTHLAVNPVYWTLAVELQFYLLLPLLVLPFRGRHWPIALAAALAITLVWRSWTADATDLPIVRLRELQLPAFLWHFALGIAAARVRHRVRELRIHPDRLDLGILAAVAGLLVLPSALLVEHDTVFGFVDWAPVVFYRPVVAVGFAAIILLACTGEGRIAAALDSRPLRSLGAWSYSLYLVHFPVGGALVLLVPGLLDLGLGPLAFVLTMAAVLVAAGFHHAVERPSLALKARLGRSRRGVPEAPAPTSP